MSHFAELEGDFSLCCSIVCQRCPITVRILLLQRSEHPVKDSIKNLEKVNNPHEKSL